MRIPRIFLEASLSAESTVNLSDDAITHIIRVLRLKAGASLIVFNGEGGEYMAVLDSTDRRHATITISRHLNRNPESPLRVQLAQGISKGERMDYTIQKSVELGISRIIPIFTQRSVVNLQGQRLHKRRQHWQGVVQSACEQCGRNLLPEVASPQQFDEWITTTDSGMKLLLDPESSMHINDLHTPDGVITLLVGPEGGLGNSEREQARDCGFTGISLGPRILRTETAALTALAVMHSLWGDI
ncbi:MAG: 16S rRNA (uracil(1498)-N(3))-methyltransferase [Gammaproteobacteria bacterium]|nr:MAG: 16S rRNA (uracil(1498)-N(3))-methyltransferase [Gammaproteobacteria bacterium]